MQAGGFFTSFASLNYRREGMSGELGLMCKQGKAAPYLLSSEFLGDGICYNMASNGERDYPREETGQDQTGRRGSLRVEDLQKPTKSQTQRAAPNHTHSGFPHLGSSIGLKPEGTQRSCMPE